MSPLLWRSSRRYLLRHPWSLALAVAGVALGVAVFVAISLANASARRAFDLSVAAVSGRATHHVEGGSAGVDEQLYAELRRAAPALEMAPTLEAQVGSPRAPGRLFRLLGVDPLAEAPVRPYLAPRPGFDLAAFLTRPGAVLLAAETARELGLEPGAKLPLALGGRTVEAFVAGTLTADDEAGRAALADLLIVDLATAQELLGRLGRLSRIDLRTEDAATLARLRARLPPGVTLEPAGGRASTMAEMTRAFRLNLQALSLLALLCGAFLIFNTVTFSVVQRRPLLGSLRTLGVTRREVFALVLTEAAALGLAGSLVGLALGVAGSRGLTHLVTRTVNDLYFALTVRDVPLDPRVLLVGLAVGVGVTLVAALPPALEATRGPARAVMVRSLFEQKARGGTRRAALVGVVALAAGAAGFLVPSRSLVLAFTAFFVLLVGCACLAPGATVLLTRGLDRLAGRRLPLVARLALRGIEASLSRTAAAVAALMIAVAVTTAVAVMIQSFRSTLVSWLETVLVADLYVSTGTPGAAAAAGSLPDALVERMRQVPGAERINTLLVTGSELGQRPIFLQAVDLDARGYAALGLLEGELDVARFTAGETVLATEPLAYQLGLRVGQELELASDLGPRRFRLAGILREYGSGRGAVLLDRGVFEAGWKARGASALAVFLAPGADLTATARALEAEAGRAGVAIEARANRTLKTTSLEIFDRTFEVTVVLRLLAGLVALLGVVQALLALQLERTRELGVLRVEGFTSRQVGTMTTLQTTLLGLIAGVLSLPVGLLMAWIMVAVINRRSFGWTLTLEVPPAALGQALLLALVAALAAGLYPGWRMARLSPAEAVREE